MSSRGCDSSSVWTDEVKARAATRIRDEMERRALSPTKVAAMIGKTQRTVERATADVPSTPPSTLVEIAEALQIPLEDVLPARTPQEQSQLDRIEALLYELSSIVAPDRTVSQMVDQGARRLEALRAEREASQPHRPAKDRAT